ncbi:DsrE family protein [Sediminicola sp. 1XM1-17]|uniref:DsrE family protein n=1 Tax=Sediminicola sp. 1XM1-17 TaxID=3127702 RepID=UPI0030777EA5
MRIFTATLFIFFLLILSNTVFAQSKNAGPIIEGFGKVFRVDNPEFKLDTQKEFKVVFDVTSSSEEMGELNLSIETAARFLNMHAQSGIPKKQLKVAMVVHSKAGKDLLNNTAYQKRYQVDNPNYQLIEALLKADVQIIMCGQSAASRGFERTELIPGVQISLSAMTALIQLDGEGYTILKL